MVVGEGLPQDKHKRYYDLGGFFGAVTNSHEEIQGRQDFKKLQCTDVPLRYISALRCPWLDEQHCCSKASPFCPGFLQWRLCRPGRHQGLWKWKFQMQPNCWNLTWQISPLCSQIQSFRWCDRWVLVPILFSRGWSFRTTSKYRTFDRSVSNSKVPFQQIIPGSLNQMRHVKNKLYFLVLCREERLVRTHTKR